MSALNSILNWIVVIVTVATIALVVDFDWVVPQLSPAVCIAAVLVAIIGVFTFRELT